MSTIPAEKQMLRQVAREALRALTPMERAARSARIAAWLREVPGPVLGFAPLPSEPDWLTGWPRTDHALPLIEGLELRFFAGPPELRLGARGIREPCGGTEIAPGAAATVLVPGLAFDRRGRRLGRGAGYYDRLLARPDLTARRIGVAFACQVVPEVPTESHDVPLDALVTEEGWIACR